MPEEQAKKPFLDIVREARALEKKAAELKPGIPRLPEQLSFVDPSPPDITSLSYFDILNELVKINKTRLAIQLTQAIYSSKKYRPELFPKKAALGEGGAETFQKTLKELKKDEDKEKKE